jgi:hypothetical protein
MERDELAVLIKKYLTGHKSDDIHDISHGLAGEIDDALLKEGRKVRDRLMDDIFGG